ncbi:MULTISPECIES: hypothetical protein [unclassified Kitasatospora]|uniref:hypothetical protein n=1 Tax=unclassified Kitasatospora TaxID=2633591 RepID=UPI0033C51B22
MFRKVLSTATIAATTVLAAGLATGSAQATDFWQAWGAGSYHTSSDFVPSGGLVHIGGWACEGGSAHNFYVSLVKTSGSQKVFSSYSWDVDGRDHVDPRGIGVNTSTAYYLRWYGNGSAPCSKAFATN